MDTTKNPPEEIKLEAGDLTLPFWRMCSNPPLQSIVLRPVKKSEWNGQSIRKSDGVLHFPVAKSAKLHLFPVKQFLGTGENEKAIGGHELKERFKSLNALSLGQIIKCCTDRSSQIAGRSVVFLSRVCLPELEIAGEKMVVLESGSIYLVPLHFLFTEASWVAVSS